MIRNSNIKYNKGCRVLDYIQFAISKKHPPLYFLVDGGRYDAVTEMNGLDYTKSEIFPQIDALEEIIKSYPHAYFINTVRNTTVHAQSIQDFHIMASHFESHLKDFSNQNSSFSRFHNIVLFIEDVKQFVNLVFRVKFPRAKYLEIDVTRPSNVQNTSKIILDFLGISMDEFIEFPHSMSNRLVNNSRI